jgi:hypothetical protein
MRKTQFRLLSTKQTFLCLVEFISLLHFMGINDEVPSFSFHLFVFQKVTAILSTRHMQLKIRYVPYHERSSINLIYFSYIN